MPDLKISQFENGGSVQPGDEIATNRAGVNTKVFAGSAAAADIGSGPDDISTNSTISATITNTLRGTSVTSVAVGVGSKEFVTQTDRAFDIGATLLVTSDSDPENIRMTGIVSAYNPATGDLEIDVSKSTGAGSYDDWTIRVAGDVGAKGDKGDQGDTGATGETGDTGATGAAGANGTNGWTPELAIVADDERRVQQVVDWAGGSGTKPATGEYVGPTGLVTDIGDAVDIRGEPGEGAVSTVNNIGPDGLGNVELNADDIPPRIATPVTISTGTYTANFSDGDIHKITGTGPFTLEANIPEGQAIVIYAIDFDGWVTPTVFFDWGEAGEPVWTGKDSFVVINIDGNYLASVFIQDIGA